MEKIMKKLPRIVKPLSVALMVASAAIAFPRAGQTQATFVCRIPQSGAFAGRPATIANTNAGPKIVISWQSERFADAGYTAMERCQEVTGRFNRLNARPGKIGIITTGYLNRSPVIYAPLQGRERASGSNLLITLKPGDDATERIQSLFDLRAGSGTQPLIENSGNESSVTFDFKQFLENAPLETGSTPEAPAAPDVPLEPATPPSGGGTSW
jgi:hypothetical protein